MPPQSLIEYINECRRRGRNIAFAHRSGYRTINWSYLEVAEVSAQFARELESRGVQPGDRVLLWGPNSAEWVVALLGCILRGAIAVPIDQGATRDFAALVVRQVGAKLAVTSYDHAQSDFDPPTIILDTLREAVAAHSPEPYPSPPMDRKSIAQIIFTSGATAEPKGVLISHGNLLANIEPLELAIQPYLKWERFVHPLRFLDLVPLSHVFGQFMGVWVPPLLGATVVFQDTLNPGNIIATIRRNGISALITVPRILESLRSKIERDLEAAGMLEAFHADFAIAANEKVIRRMWRFRQIHRRFGWKFWAVISGGATLDPGVELFWGRTGFAAIQGYGMTETTSLISVNHPFRVGRGSIGKVLAGREVKLDESGEILVRGENISQGYWQDRDIPVGLPKGEFEKNDNGWFRTGDLGALDTDGNLYFKGRKKNTIITPAGMNVYPEDLEALLRSEPEVKDCVVVGLQRGGNSEPCAVLLLRDARSVKQPRHAAGIVARVNQSLAEYQRMRTWFLWPEADFPRTATGKPRLPEIRAAVEVQWGAGNGTSHLNQINGGIGELISRMRGGSGVVNQNANLENDLRLSSLDRVELLGALEDRFQVELDETRFTSAKTVSELEKLVRGSSSQLATAKDAEFVFPRWAQRWPVRWLRTLFYYSVTLPVTHLMAHPRVFGKENLRGVKGPILVVSNHVIYLDVGFVLAALPFRLRHRLAVAMGGERLAQMRRPTREWFFPRRWLNRMNYFLAVSIFNVFPLPKTSGFRQSFRFAGELADGGWNILVFPEGELTPDGKLQPFRAGIGLLASNLKLPVVPMLIDGAYEVREARSWFNRPGRIRVHIGKPLEFPLGTNPQDIVGMLERSVSELS